MIGITMFSGLALLPPLLQNLMGYPVIETGLVMAPRGVGTMVSMIVVGRLVAKVDARLLVVFGLARHGLLALDDDRVRPRRWGTMPIIMSGLLQGLGLGFVFVPLSTLTFATLKPQFRIDATSFFSLVRNIGSGVGISVVSLVLSNMMQVNHAELAERLTATSRSVLTLGPTLLSGNPQVLAMINGLVTQQAAMLAYLDDFLLMTFVSLLALPIVLTMRAHATDGAPGPAGKAEPAAME